MPSTGIEHLSPELLQTIANYLPPSDVLKFSIAIKKAAFLKPDVDEVKINRNNMTRGKNYITNLLDFEVTSDVNEVMVTFASLLSPLTSLRSSSVSATWMPAIAPS